MPKTSHFGLFWPLHKKMTKMACFWHKTSNFDQQPPKYHKTTSYFYDKRKFLRPKIWSLGTHLGYPGSGSQAALDEIFSKYQILVILDPKSLPILVACRETAKTPKTFPPRCEQGSPGQCLTDVYDPFEGTSSSYNTCMP